MKLLPLFVSLLQVRDPLFVIVLAREHHLIENDQHAVPYSNGGSLFATSLPNASILLSEVGLRPACSMSRLDQCCSQPLIPLANATTEPFASALMLAWAVG